MEIKTKFNIGDTAYAVWQEYEWEDWFVAGPMAIGKITIEKTDGTHAESYMCAETGLKAGNIYLAELLFKSKNDATLVMQLKNQEPQ